MTQRRTNLRPVCVLRLWSLIAVRCTRASIEAVIRQATEAESNRSRTAAEASSNGDDEQITETRDELCHGNCAKRHAVRILRLKKVFSFLITRGLTVSTLLKINDISRIC